jgi:hypothetical protein
MEFSNGRLEGRQQCSDIVWFGLVTLQFQAIATSPHPAGPSAGSSQSSTGQKLKQLTVICLARYMEVEKCRLQLDFRVALLQKKIKKQNMFYLR